MKHIFVIGAGRSATDLIDYLLQHAGENDWLVTVGDMSLDLAQHKVNGHAQGKAVYFDAGNAEMRAEFVAQADVVVSLLPPFMHPLVAQDCLRFGKHLVTASYISADMAALHEEAKEKGLIFLNELGADPGIDHLSIMRGIDSIKAKGGKITEMRSYCGSLIAPESNNNPWGYKFTWSPMNVIVAGQGAACYLKDGKRAFIPYNRLFSEIDTIEVEGVGTFDAYANRDSYSYIKTYDLADVQTLLRGTLRLSGYCEGWNAFIRIGLTANDYKIAGSEGMTHREWLASYLPKTKEESVEEALARFLGTTINSPLMERIISTGLLEESPITRQNATPAEILYDLLMQKWVFLPQDKDMLVMADKLVYELAGETYIKTSTMVVVGKDYEHTAISQTVGLPAAMGVKLILQEKIIERGVIAPITSDIYVPILNDLAEYGIAFTEKVEKK